MQLTLLLPKINFSELISFILASKQLAVIDLILTIIGVLCYFKDKSESGKIVRWTVIVVILITIVSGADYYVKGVHNLKPEFIDIQEEEYNYKITYPEYFDLIADYSDFKELISKDKQSYIIIQAKMYDDMIPLDFTVDSFYKEHNNQNKISEFGSLEKEGWYVASYESIDKFYYTKCIAGNHIAKKYVFSFPLSQREYYNDENNFDYVDKIEDSFRNLK